MKGTYLETITALENRVVNLENALEALQKAQEQRLQETPGFPMGASILPPMVLTFRNEDVGSIRLTDKLPECATYGTFVKGGSSHEFDGG